MGLPQQKNKNDRGFIKTIVAIVIVLVILAFFGFDLVHWVKSPRLQSAFWEVWSFLGIIWADYIVRPAIWIWQHFIIGFVWEDVIRAGIEKVRSL